MRILRHLQHWLTRHGFHIAVADFVPETQPVRQGADTFPGAALVAAVDCSFAQRFPTPPARGRRPGASRVLVALALLKQEWHCADEQICSQWRTDLAVRYACGMRAVQAAAALEQGVVSPAPLVVDPFPSEPGSQRVTEAATREKAKKPSSRSWRLSPSTAPPRARR